MARFTGSGAFTVPAGDYARVHDIDFQNTGGVTVSASNAQLRSCRIARELTVTSILYVSVYECYLDEVTWSGNSGQLTGSVVLDGIAWSGDYGMIHDCFIDDEVVVTGDQFQFRDNRCDHNGDLLQITADDALVVGNYFEPTGGDAVVIAGNRNQVMSNRFLPGGSADSAVTLNSGECNMVVGNDLGDSGDYATDAIVDNAANTQLFWPNDATYGDNFTDCGTGS